MYPHKQTPDEQPFKSFGFPYGPKAELCSHCGKRLTIRGVNSFEPEQVQWSYRSDYYECSDWKGHWQTDKQFCTKACAVKARK